MINQFSRTQMLLGENAMKKFGRSKVIIFGIGGVGGYVAEGLARAGVGQIDLVDNDVVSLTNLNRQIVALHSTIGKFKVDVCLERLLDINPNLTVNAFKTFYLPSNSSDFDFTKYDYVVDAIDTVSAKIELAVNANKTHTKIISCMGTGNKLDPTAFEVADIYSTSVCPLARVMRRELKARNVPALKVLFSKEEAIHPLEQSEEETSKRATPSSVSFVPSVAGLIIAGEVIKDLAQK